MVFARFILKCNCTSYCWLYVFSIVISITAAITIDAIVLCANIIFTYVFISSLLCSILFIYIFRCDCVIHRFIYQIIWWRRPHVHGLLQITWHYFVRWRRCRYNNFPHFTFRQIGCISNKKMPIFTMSNQFDVFLADTSTIQSSGRNVRSFFWFLFKQLPNVIWNCACEERA